jgi:hypothetical protein
MKRLPTATSDDITIAAGDGGQRPQARRAGLVQLPAGRSAADQLPTGGGSDGAPVVILHFNQAIKPKTRSGVRAAFCEPSVHAPSCRSLSPPPRTVDPASPGVTEKVQRVTVRLRRPDRSPSNWRKTGQESAQAHMSSAPDDAGAAGSR